MGLLGLLGMIIGAFCCSLCLKSCCSNQDYEDTNVIILGNQELTRRSLEEVPPKYEDIDR